MRLPNARPALFAVGLLLGCCPLLAAEFEAVAIHLERNVSDGDAEVVIELTGDDCGINRLTIRRPDGVIVGSYSATDARGLGAREILLESPEPEAAAVLAAYPPGLYRFRAETLCGAILRGGARLAHAFPDPSEILFPEDEATGIPSHGLVLEWDGVAGAEHYVVEIENEEGLNLKTTVPGSVTSLSVPDELLAPDTEYEIGVGTYAENGNGSFVESSFTTAP